MVRPLERDVVGNISVCTVYCVRTVMETDDIRLDADTGCYYYYCY